MMKSHRSFSLRLAVLAGLGVLLLALTSAAANNPLNFPQGLAVAHNGNLYVANTNGNEILVYSPAHVQLTAKTITKGISNPTGVAFDLYGDLWVANVGTNSITDYSSSGVQQTAFTISNGISAPAAIAFDGLNDLWVNNGYSNLRIYPAQSQTSIVSINENNAITGIAAYREFAVIGNNTGAAFTEISPLLANSSNPFPLPDTCFAPAYDSAGELYCGNENHTLTTYTGKGQNTLVNDLGFFPLGVAVDKVHGFIYASNANGNSIAVYNRTGTLVTTIK